MHRIDIHVFLIGNEVRAAVEQALTDRRLSKTRTTYYEGSIPAASQKYDGEPSPGLLIVETHEHAGAMFEQLDRLSQMCRPGTELILLGGHNDVALYRQLAKRGVREYIPAPVEPAHLLDAALGVCADPNEAKCGRLISFIGASGGVGSSTIANNIAWQLGKAYDEEVALIDLDLAFGTAGLDFNLESPQTSAQALAQVDRIDDQMIERFLVRYNDNLALLTAPGDGDTTADVDLQALDGVIKTLRRNVAWVAVDLPHYWGGWVRHMLGASDEIVLTAVPTLASLRNAKAAADTLNAARKNDAPVRIVLNRLGATPKTDIPTKDFVNTLGSTPAVMIPYEPTLFAHAANAGRPVAETSRTQRVLEPFGKLATLVSGRPRLAKPKRATASEMFQRVVSWSVRPVGRAAS